MTEPSSGGFTASWISLTVLSESLVLYVIVRIVMTAFDTGVLSFRKYWSRLMFRICFLVHFATVPYLYRETDLTQLVVVAGYCDNYVQMLGYVFLIKSVQDFAAFSERQIKWISKWWILIAVVVVCLEFAIDGVAMAQELEAVKREQSGAEEETVPLLWYLFGLVLQLVVVDGLVFTPLLVFVASVLNSVMTQELRRNAWFVLVLVFATMILGIGLWIAHMVYRIKCWKTGSKDKTFLSTPEIFMRVLWASGFLWIQDGLDWMAKWLLGDDTLEVSDDVLCMPIITTDPSEF